MKKHLFLFIVFITTLTLLFPLALSQNGEIYKLEITPSQPVVFERAEKTIGVRNNGASEMNYKLKVFFVKDGVIKDENEYSFNLMPNKGTLFSVDFYPDDIGEYQIIAKLYDQLETNLIDSKLTKFAVISQIGPFDLRIDTPTDVIGPGQVLPLLLTMANMGEKGTDVEIRIELPCLNQSNIVDGFYLFLNNRSSTERLTSIPTCDEEGIHSIFAHIILFNKTFMTSVTQFVINRTVAQISIEVDNEFVLEKTKTKTFDVLVRNNGLSAIHGLQLFIEKIPLSWVNTSPKVIDELAPNQTAAFVVSITVPEEAQLETYPIKVAATSDEFLKRADSTIKVLHTSAVSYPNTGPAIFDSLYATISQNAVTIGLGGAGVLALSMTSIFIWKRAETKRTSTSDKLRKLKESIK